MEANQVQAFEGGLAGVYPLSFFRDSMIALENLASETTRLDLYLWDTGFDLDLEKTGDLMAIRLKDDDRGWEAQISPQAFWNPVYDGSGTFLRDITKANPAITGHPEVSELVKFRERGFDPARW